MNEKTPVIIYYSSWTSPIRVEALIVTYGKYLRMKQSNFPEILGSVFKVIINPPEEELNQFKEVKKCQ